MSVSATSSTTNSGTANNLLNDDAPITTDGTKTLGADDFLKLLTTQLSNQDPMKPMDDTQFISQMAQFTSLEQMRSLNTNFGDFEKAQTLSTAQQYLGKNVTIDGDNGTITGNVDQIRMIEGAPVLIVGGKTYDPADVTDIRQATAAAAAAN